MVDSRLAQRGAAVSLITMAILVAVKLAAGVLSGSVSVLAEALQSTVDILISVGVLFAVRISAKPPDETHPYGHGKAELLMTALQMILLVGTALFVGFRAITRLTHPVAIEADIGLAVMVFSGLVAWGISLYLARVARISGSSALKSEVLHIRSDAFSALGIVIGLVVYKLTGWWVVDPIAALAFTMIISVMSINQLRTTVHDLMDGALSPEELGRLREILTANPNVMGFHKVRTRRAVSDRFIELHVMLDDELTFVRAHEVAEGIENEIRAGLGGVSVNVHYEPYHAELAHQEEAHKQENADSLSWNRRSDEATRES